MFRVIALASAALFVGSSAFAADVSGATAPAATPVEQQGALAPGGAAGVNHAQEFTDDTLYFIAGGAIVVGGVVLILSNNGHGHTTMGTTSSTPK